MTSPRSKEKSLKNQTVDSTKKELQPELFLAIFLSLTATVMLISVQLTGGGLPIFTQLFLLLLVIFGLLAVWRVTKHNIELTAYVKIITWLLAFVVAFFGLLWFGGSYLAAGLVSVPVFSILGSLLVLSCTIMLLVQPGKSRVL